MTANKGEHMQKRSFIRIGLAVIAMSMATPALAEEVATPSNNATPAVGTQYAAKAGVKRRVRRGGVRKGPAVVHEVKRPARWVYMAKRMRPPKAKKWVSRWNTLGEDGWELVGQSENVYIFKRPSDFGWSPPVAEVAAPAAAANPAKPAKVHKAKKHK